MRSWALRIVIGLIAAALITLMIAPLLAAFIK